MRLYRQGLILLVNAQVTHVCCCALFLLHGQKCKFHKWRLLRTKASEAFGCITPFLTGFRLLHDRKLTLEVLLLHDANGMFTTIEVPMLLV